MRGVCGAYFPDERKSVECEEATMARMRWAVILLAVMVGGGICFAQEGSGKEEGAEVREKIAGVWRGNSVCLDKNSPCHDEVNVYRFTKIAGRADAFLVTASKVVEGKEIEMGSGEWKYDEKKQVVESREPRIRLSIQGDKMQGLLTLPDGTQYRKIYLKKAS